MIPDFPQIFLLTDFATIDHYVAVMKAVVLARCPGAGFVDISHDVSPQNIVQGCYLLEAAWPWIPAGSVVLAVVDPGVGGSREPAVFYHEEKTIIGPNNGLFGFLPADLEGRVLDNPEYWMSQVSSTFHGRDIFAPCAAFIAAGGHWALLGDTPARPVCLEQRLREGNVPGSSSGHVVHFDHFGNAISNIRTDDVGVAVSAEIPGKLHCPIGKTYSDVLVGAPMAYVGSTGRLEIAVCNGNARQQLGLELNDIIIIHTEKALK